MLKKCLTFLLICAVSCSLLAGCSNGENGETKQTNSIETDTIDYSKDPNKPMNDNSNRTEIQTNKTEKPAVDHTPDAGKLMALCDQKNGEIAVINLDNEDWTSPKAVKWKWNASNAGNLAHPNYLKRVDDAKLRNVKYWGGKIVGITSSAGLACLVKYPSGQVVWEADLAGYGPHSIDILPSGLIAVACSGNGNEAKSGLFVFRGGSGSDMESTLYPCNSAHGVLWDPTEECLWLLGSSGLSALKVSGKPTDGKAPTVTLIEGKGARMSGGHDLSPNYADPDILWCTGSEVKQFSKSKNAFLDSYNARGGINVSSTKSINTFHDGTTIITIAKGDSSLTATHNTDTVTLFRWKLNKINEWNFRKESIVFPDRHFYKCRAFIADYQ